MKCPHCGKEFPPAIEHQAVDDHKLCNADRCRKPQIVRVNCCGMGAVLSCSTVYHLVPYSGDHEKDDWGDDICKP